ncbi:unnamed protein product [Macrosiphum euphorbiae]|uniref:Uncharacterized protein n=1 Tax=Macrosiphum euphorbiae TaxID=13131 RepID=A0AAV0WC70_9HEMI|nr:unnamed protein product [Macrosiphum euphorbiae]
MAATRHFGRRRCCCRLGGGSRPCSPPCRPTDNRCCSRHAATAAARAVRRPAGSVPTAVSVRSESKIMAKIERSLNY